MRGADRFTESLFTVSRLEDFIPGDHPLRPIRAMVNQALGQMDALFASMYASDVKGGRPSIAPEKLIRAMLLQVFYSVRSERMLMEQTRYNLLFRWFIGLAIEDAVWVPTVFTKNRERLIEHKAIIELFEQLLAIAREKDYLSGEHFSVDGTLIQAWAGHKSFVKKPSSGDSEGGNAGGVGGALTTTAALSASALQSAVAGRDESAQFKGERRSNDTHQSTTDAEARLYRKGRTGAELRFVGHTLMDNRHGLISDTRVTQADGHCEREAAKAMIQKARAAIDAPEIEITLGADKGYDAKEFIEACVAMNVVPHVSQNTAGRRSAVPDEIAASAGYAVSVQKRKLIEQGFGWAKTIGSIRQVMQRGLKRVNQIFTLTMAAYNLTRMRSLDALRLRTQQ